jgi:hypothetical protein
MLIIKPSELGLVKNYLRSSEMSIKTETLDHKKRKAIYLLATKSWGKREVAEKVGVSTRLLRHWLTLPEFNSELDRWTSRFVDVDKEYRKKQAQKVLPFIWEELFRRVALDPEEIKSFTTRDLQNVLRLLQQEMRLDTDGEVTQKVGHFELDKLSDRFNKSTSGKIAQKAKVANIEDYRDGK